MFVYRRLNRARFGIKIDDVVCLKNVFRNGDKIHSRFVNSDNHTSFSEIGPKTVGMSFFFVDELTNRRFEVIHTEASPSNRFMSPISGVHVSFWSIIPVNNPASKKRNKKS